MRFFFLLPKKRKFEGGTVTLAEGREWSGKAPWRRTRTGWTTST
jgi:tuftelin-interacting protein 11